MKHVAGLLAVGVLATAACSALPSTTDGVVALQIRTQTPIQLPQGDRITLAARALNQAGDSVPAVIRWRTNDTAAVFLDSLTGIVEGRLTTGSARVQAAVGTLLSDPITISLLPPLPSALRSP